MLIRNSLTFDDGIHCISNNGASYLASLGFIFFLIGRFSGAGILKKFSAHKVLGLYAALNVGVCLLVFLKLGWLSVACVFLSYFFMSIMFPTIFALGIFGLGARAKKASSFIVMAIMGGAILPKLMGARCRQVRHVAQFHRAHGLLRLSWLVRLLLAETQRRGFVRRSENFRRTLVGLRIR